MFTRILPSARAVALPAFASQPAARLVLRAAHWSNPPKRPLATISKETSLPGGGEEEKRPSAIASRLPDPQHVVAPQRFREFELDGRVFVVTGGARGLGLALAEVLVEAGGNVYCLDRAEQPEKHFWQTRDELAHHFRGTLDYRQVDVTHAEQLDQVIAEIAEKHQRMDGLIANAGIQWVQPALEYEAAKVSEMYNVNCGGVFLSARACAKQMIKYGIPGSIVLVGSMSGLNANKGFTSVHYNASKAGVIQMGRSLAMEWGQIVSGKPIRVNVLCPGNILTPMVQNDFRNDPTLRAKWEAANMMGRISETKEYRGAALFMLSDASSFMTASHLVIDGGYTAW
ncbi:hypothetical protein D0860_02685 [Hortaea werneckii]|uniref:Uncharacterized protein n=1 Tax=Hortaea werneckii TaxID=91943 RepID=A0A3M7HJ57_HORWE|nr:hypothetical protein D0860_02685 [Hortaea werneckii]